MKQELINKIESAREKLKDFATYGKLLSDNDGERELAELRRILGSILLMVKANDIKDLAHPGHEAIKEGLWHKQGTLVKIRPCGDEYQDKTYLGFYIGDIAKGSSISMKDDIIQLDFAGHNPAIFIPELGKIIYGYESWWGKIENEEQLTQITDNDIQNVWYVQLWKTMNNSQEPQNDN